MTPPAILPDVVRYVGDDWSFIFEWTQPGALPGDPDVPIDMTGFGITGELYHTHTTVPILLTTDNGGAAFEDAAAGRFRIDVAKEVTAEFQADSAFATYRVHRLQVLVTFGSGKTATILIQPIEVKHA
jgi:hypothetical protein